MKKISKEKFETYLAIQESGETNMLDIDKVVELAMEYSDTELTREDVLDIQKNYDQYLKEYAKGSER
jgi:DNA repair protein RadC